MIRRFPSLFLLVLSVIGLFVTDQGRIGWDVLVVMGTALFLIGLYLLSRRRQLIATVCLGLAFATLVSFQFSLNYVRQGSNHVSHMVDSKGAYRIYGQVADWPLLKTDRTEIKISLDSLGAGDGHSEVLRGVTGSILLKISDSTTMLQRGDRVNFRGRIYLATQRSEWEGFDYNRYLNLQGIFGVCYLPTALAVTIDHRPEVGFYSMIDNLRSAIVSTFQENLAPVPAALAGGFLIGETRNIPPDIYKMFRDSGTLHVLAVSGSNVALVLLFMLFVLRPFWLRPLWRTIVLAIVIIVFNGLSYGDPSILRASVMASLVLIARLAGRKFDLNNVIALTALVILVLDPAQLFGVGFQLSFATAWGLIFFIPLIARPFEPYHGRFWYRWLVFPVAVVMVAQACSMPLIAYYFNEVPVISPLANLVIVPLVSISLFGVLAMLAAAVIHPFLGQVVGAFLELILNLTIGLLRWFGGEHVPMLSISPRWADNYGVVVMVCFYALLILIGLAITRAWLRKAALVGFILFANVLVGLALIDSLARQENQVSLHRVPGGIAAIVGLEDGRADLILTGLISRDYTIDERILQPLLDREEVGQLDQLFVIGADFNALDDILRLARSTQASRLWLDSDLRSAASDSRFRGLTDSLELRYFGGTISSQPENGYVATRNHLTLSRSGHTFVFIPTADGLGKHSPNLTVSSGVLVVGGRLPNAPELWLKLRSAGYSRVVCPVIEQSPQFGETDPLLDPNGIVPDFAIELSKIGTVRF